jgi:hypothetical protein
MTCHSIARTIQYNENKIILDEAKCLVAANFLKDAYHLTVDDKLRRFERRMELNDRVSTNLHITLNLDPLDKLSDEQMARLCKEYMKELGFERQPYLVYRHVDAGHPHCHIVTTHVQKNGDPIDLYKIGQNQSEKARLRLEAEFGLVTTEMKREVRQQQREQQKQKMGDSHGPRKVIYGEQSLAKSMSDVLEYVTEKYKLTSLAELNVLLRLYNVVADPGKEGTKLRRDRGLRYRALDDQGRHIGRPLNASFFDCKPTLDNLEKKFILNHSLKQQVRPHVDTCIRWELYHKPDDFENLKTKLNQAHILMVLRHDKAGNCSQVAYVDYRNKAVFMGEELGSRCDHHAIQQLMERQKNRQTQPSEEQNQRQSQRQALRRTLRPRIE